MRAGIGDARLAEACYRGDSGEAENGDRKDEDGKHGHLNVISFNFFAEIFWSAAHHQASKEYSDDDEDDHPVKTGTYAAKDHFSKKNVDKRDHSAERSERIVHGVHGAAARVRGNSSEERGANNSEPRFFAFEVAGGSGCRRCGLERISWVRLGSVDGKNGCEKESGHGSPDGPAVARRFGHSSERVGEPAGNGEDENHLKEICERRGIFVRMRAVRIEETATVRAEFFDGFLRSDGALRNHLLACRGGIQRGDRLIWMKILDNALRNKKKCYKKAGRQEDPERSASNVHPKIADGLRADARDTANERDGESDAYCGRYEIVVRKTNHLREVAHGGFGNVGLPIRICRETDSGVPGEHG